MLVTRVWVISVVALLVGGCRSEPAAPAAEARLLTAGVADEQEELAFFDETLADTDTVVVGTVARTSAEFGITADGQKTIYTDATVTVQETLRGSAQSLVTVRVEGGTVDGESLEVSDHDLPQPGDRGVFLLGRSSQGRHVARAHGVLLLDGDQPRGRGRWLSLERIRERVTPR